MHSCKARSVCYSHISVSLCVCVCVVPASSCPAAVSPWTVYVSKWWDPAPHLHIQTPPPPPPAPCPSSTAPPPLPPPWSFLSLSLSFPFSSFLPGDPPSSSSGPAWTHQCFPPQSKSSGHRERERERTPPTHPTPFLCWASWCKCVCVHSVCVCVRHCSTSVDEVCPPSTSAPPLTTNAIQPLPWWLHRPFLSSSLLLHYLRFFLPYLQAKSHFLKHTFFFFPSRINKCYIVHLSLCFLSSLWSLSLSLLICCEPWMLSWGCACVLPVRLILITGHIVHLGSSSLAQAGREVRV